MRSRWAWLSVCVMAAGVMPGEVSAGDEAPFWQRSCAQGIARGTPERPAALDHATIGPMARAGAGGAGDRSLTNRQALGRALMSAVIPGTGQLRNGSLMRGLAYMAVEVSGWLAHTSFRDDSRDKKAELARHAAGYWNYDRYARVAVDPDSCDAYGCNYGYWTSPADSLIQDAQTAGGTRFYDYISRVDYACGWSSPLSRDLYLDLWNDREDLLSRKRLTGRIIFLNHVISAVDAFMEARRLRLNVGPGTELGFDVKGPPGRLCPFLVFQSRFN